MAARYDAASALSSRIPTTRLSIPPSPKTSPSVSRTWASGQTRSPRGSEAALERFGLAGFGERLIHNLSGGEKQRVALLSVTIMEPACIVLDEPTTGLDLRNQYRFMAAIAEMPATIIMVSHDLAALEGFDRVIWFEAGRIAGDGPPGEVIPAYVQSCR